MLYTCMKYVKEATDSAENSAGTQAVANTNTDTVMTKTSMKYVKEVTDSCSVH